MSSARSLHPILDPLALSVDAPPLVKSLTAHAVAAAHDLKLFARAKVVKDFQADFVGANTFFHFAGTKKLPRATEVARGLKRHEKDFWLRRETFALLLIFDLYGHTIQITKSKTLKLLRRVK